MQILPQEERCGDDDERCEGDREVHRASLRVARVAAGDCRHPLRQTYFFFAVRRRLVAGLRVAARADFFFAAFFLVFFAAAFLAGAFFFAAFFLAAFFFMGIDSCLLCLP